MYEYLDKLVKLRRVITVLAELWKFLSEIISIKQKLIKKIRVMWTHLNNLKK